MLGCSVTRPPAGHHLSPRRPPHDNTCSHWPRSELLSAPAAHMWLTCHGRANLANSSSASSARGAGPGKCSDKQGVGSKWNPANPPPPLPPETGLAMNDIRAAPLGLLSLPFLLSFCSKHSSTQIFVVFFSPPLLLPLLFTQSCALPINTKPPHHHHHPFFLCVACWSCYAIIFNPHKQHWFTCSSRCQAQRPFFIFSRQL